MPFAINVDGTFPEIGPKFDFGLATRDGSSLMCKNKDGNLVPVQRMAYMLSVDKQKTMKESTELQEKQKLVQLGTATSIDREFDQWVQNTQGDWSGGTGQRVYGQNSIVNQYFDGQGLLWPLNDYIPQVPLTGPIRILPANFQAFGLSDVAGGFLNGGGQGYTYTAQHTDNNWYAHFTHNDTTVNVQVETNVNGFNLLAITIGAGFIFIVANQFPVTTNMKVYQVGFVNGAFTLVHADVLGDPAAGYGAGAATAIVTAAFVSQKLYVAIAAQSLDSATLTNWQSPLWILDYSAPGVPGGLTTPTDFSKAATGTSGPAMRFVDLAWQGPNLFVSVSDGFSATVLELAAPFTTVTTAASLSGLSNAFMCSAGSTLFLVGVSYGASSTVNRMDIFTLTGGQLTEFGNINTPVPILDSVCSPVAFGGYALWAVSYTAPGASTKTITVYAFDVVRSRLFRAISVTNSFFTGNDVFGHNEIAVFGTTTRTLQAGVTFQAQWGFALFTGGITSAGETAREYYFGVVPLTPAPAFNGLLQMGVDIISGIFDFTAATNKLYRQIVAEIFDGLVAGQSTPGVILNAWFNQDPGRLNASPDFTISTGTPQAPLPAELDLPTNEVARKLVYEVISLGGGYNATANAWQNACKIVDVIVQAATGWVWDLVVDLNPNVKTNGNNANEFAYSAQSPTDATSLSYDHVCAYNFLKQLWRLQGGKCTIYLPNGDTYPALLQLEEYESPKPIAGIGRSDVQPSWQVFSTLKIREDI